MNEIGALRREADRLASDSASACVRSITEQSQIFREISISPRILALLPDQNLLPVRSILFDKTPLENWPVAWHQDLTICVEENISCPDYGPWSLKNGVPHVQPPVKLLESMATVRIHLDPTGSNNGALMVIPGSHRHGRLSRPQIEELTAIQPITCECEPGDILLMSPLILHASRRSQHPSRRRILHLEYAPTTSLDPLLTWHETTSIPA
jgi:ectoine hydroxylase-related dioxygenase (phytanoyl-CoA dioxygenase family)